MRKSQLKRVSQIMTGLAFKRNLDNNNNSIIFASLVIVIVFSGLLFLPTIPKSFAHAFVINSDPSPSQSLPTVPSKVVVHFSEPVDLRFSKISILDSNGKQVDNKNIHNVGNDQSTLSVTLPANLRDGVYTVTTKVLSQTDGHVTENAFVFGVGKATIPTSVSNQADRSSSSQLYIPDAIARFPALVGQVIIVGSAFSTLWLWRPISKIPWIKDSIQEIRKGIDRSMVILTGIGSVILLISDLGMIYVQANSVNIGIGEAISTKFGSIWIIRVVESFLLLAISLILYRKLNKSNRNFSASTKPAISILAIGILTLVTTSLIGHGASNGQLLPITVDFVHNLAASVWIGGVIYMAFIVAPKIKSASLEGYTKASVLSILIPRFSTIPVIILGIIVVTGPLLLYILESNLDLTLASLYGKALIVKLSLAAIMIGIGGYNQMIIQRHAYKIVVTEAKLTTNGSSVRPTVKKTDNTLLNKFTDKLRRIRSGNSKNAWDYKDSEDKNCDNYSIIEGVNHIVNSFSKSTKLEAIVGIALLAAVAVLVNTGLPASEFQNYLQKQQQEQQSVSALSAVLTAAIQQGLTSTQFVANDSRVVLSIDPFTTGNNEFKISFLDSKTGAPKDIKSVQLELTQIDNGIGPIKIDTRKVSKGVFSANGAFGIPGHWDIQIEGVQNKPNSPNIVTVFNSLNIKPRLDELKFNIKEFKIPGNNNSQPLYPVYDTLRNVIWVGDTAIDSGRIFEFNITSNKYTEHKVNATSIVTVMALDPKNRILWYADPLMKQLGRYDTNTHLNKVYKIPIEEFLPSGIAIDNNSNVWLTSTRSNGILLKYNPQTTTFTSLRLPTINATTLGIKIDDITGQIWVAEDIGKIANIDPTNNFKVTEYSPTGKNNTLKSPTGLLVDPITGNIYISEHDGHAVSLFNPLLKTFKRFPSLNKNGLPFGMALDSYGNLWVAEHIINKVAVIDPMTGLNKEVEIPTTSPFVQWITSDSKGNIWLAEQRGNSLAMLSSIMNPSQQNPTTTQQQQSGNVNGNNSQLNGIPKLGLSYADVVGPSVAGGIVVSALFYAKSIMDLKNSVIQANRKKNANYDK